MSAARSMLLRGATTAIVTTLWMLPVGALAQSSPSDFTSGTRYDIASRVTGTISPDPDGAGPNNYAAVRNTYDAAGRLIMVEKGELASWQSEAIAPSAWTGFTVFNKVETTFDGQDRKTIVLLSGWNSTTSSWVPNALTQYSYDSLGRPECTTVRMNPATWGSLPASACTLTTTGSNGPDRITKVLYTDTSKPSKMIKAFGQTAANGLEPLQQDYVTVTYNNNDQQATLTDANGNVAAYAYDGFDRLIAWSFPSKTTLGATATCTIGTITETTDAFGAMVTSPSESRGSGDDCEKYAYDRNGARTKLMRRDGNIIRYGYDNLNRVSVKDIPGGTAEDVYYGYDTRNLQTFARFVSASGSGITNVFDGFGTLTSTTNNMGTSAQTLSYQYDANNNRKQFTFPDGAYFTYDYDKLNRPIAIKESGGATIVSWTYDQQGRPGTQTRGAVVSTYGYDTISRMASLTDDLSGTANDITTTLVHNPANQILTKLRSNVTYSFPSYVNVSRPYTVNGQNQYLTAGAASFNYSDNGNLTTDGTNNYTYDVENRMTGMTGVATIKYDPLGRLWQVVLANKTQEFVSDGDSIVKEYNGAVPFWYIHGPGKDDPLIQYSGVGLTTRQSFQSDQQGSIVSVADASGAAFRVNTYDEYGIPAYTNYSRFMFNGQAWFAQLGLYYYKARMYSPTLGRFMQTDPIGYKDQNNLYAYVGNDPINNNDPTGTQVEVSGNERDLKELTKLLSKLTGLKVEIVDGKLAVSGERNEKVGSEKTAKALTDAINDKETIKFKVVNEDRSTFGDSYDRNTFDVADFAKFAAKSKLFAGALLAHVLAERLGREDGFIGFDFNHGLGLYAEDQVMGAEFRFNSGAIDRGLQNGTISFNYTDTSGNVASTFTFKVVDGVIKP